MAEKFIMQEELQRDKRPFWLEYNESLLGGTIVNIQRDTKGQPFIEWEQAGGYKRAWIQRRTDPDKDWASTPEGRYLNVVRIEQPGSGPAGNATDFPIFSPLSDEQILEAFVSTVSAITGCRLP